MKGYVEIARMPIETKMNITVKVTKGFRIRVTLAKWLFILAAHILGCSPKIEYKEEV